MSHDKDYCHGFVLSARIYSCSFDRYPAYRCVGFNPRCTCGAPALTVSQSSLDNVFIACAVVSSLGEGVGLLPRMNYSMRLPVARFQ